MNIGIIGCGTISSAYFEGARKTDILEIKACADLRMEAAQAQAENIQLPRLHRRGIAHRSRDRTRREPHNSACTRRSRFASLGSRQTCLQRKTARCGHRKWKATH